MKLNIKKVVVRTQADSPSLEVVFEDGLSAKLILGQTHEWKIKNGILEKEQFFELNKCYLECSGRGFNPKKFLFMMKEGIEARHCTTIKTNLTMPENPISLRRIKNK